MHVPVWMVLTCMILATAAGAAYAQPVLESVEAVPATGRLTLVFDSPVDPFSISTDRIHVVGAGYDVVLTPNEISRVETHRITFETRSDAAMALRSGESIHVRLDEGAITSGVPNLAQVRTVEKMVRLGVAAPDDDLDMILMAQFAVERLNQEIADVTIDIIFNMDDDIRSSLLKLDRMGVDMIVGPGDILHERHLVDSSTVLVACCTPHQDDRYVGDLHSFALVPNVHDGLAAILSYMAEQEINRIIPVYQDNGAGHAMMERIKRGAYSAVDTGLVYDARESADMVTQHLAETVARNQQDHPSARLGILLATPDAGTILVAASEDPMLGVPQWFSVSAHTLDTVPAVVLAGGIQYSAPMFDAPYSPLSTLLGVRIYEATGTWPYPGVYSAYDAVYLGVQALLDTGSMPLHDVMIILADDHGGASGYTGLNAQGGLESPAHYIVTIRGGEWAKVAIHSNPTYERAGIASMDDISIESHLYIPGDNQISPMERLGLLVGGPDAAQTIVAARMGLILGDNDPVVELVVQDTRLAPDAVSTLGAMGVDMVLVHVDAETASQATHHDLTVLATSYGTADQENMYRMVPSSESLAGAISGVMREDGIDGVVIIHDASMQDVRDEMEGGRIPVSLVPYGGADQNGTDQNGTDQNGAEQAADEIRQMVRRHGASGTGVLLLVQDTAGVLNAMSSLGVSSGVNWYGAGPDAWNLALGGAGDFASQVQYAVVAPAVSHSVPAQLVSASLPYRYPIPISALYVLEAAHIAGQTISAVSNLGGQDSDVVGTVLQSVTAGPGLVLDDTTLGEGGNLASPSFDVWSIAEDQWTRTAIYEAKRYLDLATVGIAVPITGDRAQYGVIQAHAAQHAITQTNESLESARHSWRMAGIVADTAADPAQALTRLQNMGVNAVLGPSSLAGVGSYNMTLISCCSEWPQERTNNSYSLSPGLSGQAGALLALLEHDDIHTLILVFPNNDREEFLAENIAVAFGDSVITLKYDPAASYDDLVKSMVQRMSGIDEQIGVVLLGHTESILESLILHGDPDAARWYGASHDGVLPDLSPPLMSYAHRLGLMVAVQAVVEPVPDLDAYLQAATGLEPYVGAYAMHDSASLLGSVLSRLGGNTTDLVPDLVPSVAKYHTGSLGAGALDPQRNLGTRIYDIWAATPDGWNVMLRYDGSSDSLADVQ